MADRLRDDVGELLRQTATDIVLPLFRRLDDADIVEKAPGDLVTVADRRAEERISEALRRLLPGSVVVGEEAVAEHPDLLRHLRGGGDVWLVDPVDGTNNFAVGRSPFALMVALLTDGEMTGAWVLDPLAGVLADARLGAGTRLDGKPVRAADVAAPPDGRMRGTAMTRYLPPAVRTRVEAGGARLGELLPGQHCAGREYLDLLTGDHRFVLFWRTLPWDHAPGVLLVREAGGVARRFDGADYHPGDDRPGLLVAADEATWSTARAALLDH
ncbi:inositol monophosphatase family protein [Micromonospora sp. KC723]|uniref:inositol monophosphatase family protein n=1 Tax=Micromonospora sp. KC723 TaxID=2530381 RepID=UPI001051C5AB|nr:inositol monophosphatase family protein [Micromonospora sp. KC723]TDB75902.1 inositol monophosphatase [Micromonospora sp. KC723]